MNHHRHSYFRLLLAALVLSGLAACSSTGTDASADGNTRTISDAKGRSVQVPSAPQRVMALSEPTLDGALALKVPVIGASSGRGQGGVSAYLADRAAGIEVVASVAGPDLEQIASKSPDLILIDGTVSADDAVVDKLSAIAPTVYVSTTGTDWKAAFRAEADALNLAAQGETVLADYSAQIATVKSTLGSNADATVSIVRWSPTAPAMLLKEIASSTVVADLGLRRPASQDKAGPGHSVPISLERLDQLDADWLFLGTLGGASVTSSGSGTKADVDASRSALQTAAASTPGFTRLNAYQLGHVVAVDGSAWTSAGGPLAARVVLDSIATALART